MSEGRVLQVGAPGEMYETPANRFVADFIGNVNLMDGRVDRGRRRSLRDRLRRLQPLGRRTASVPASGAPVAVALRPEKIRLARTEPRRPAQPGARRGPDLSYFGAVSVYHLRLDSGRVLKISEVNAERQRVDRLAVGDSAWASWSDTRPGGADAVKAPLVAAQAARPRRAGRRWVIALPYRLAAGVLPAAVPDRVQDQRVRDGRRRLQRSGERCRRRAAAQRAAVELPLHRAATRCTSRPTCRA